MIKKVYLYQPGRFGDIFFVIPIARRLIEKGYEVIFPVNEPRLVGIKDHFPDINFIPHDNKKEIIKEPCLLLPLWHASNIEKREEYNSSRLMSNKYRMYNKAFDDDLNPEIYWHNLTWKRFPEKEKKLMETLGIKQGEKYMLINELYGWGRIPIKVNTDLKKIYFKITPGYTLLDWSLVIENAEEIHCVDTSVLYIIDRLKTTDKLHRYRRIREDVELGHLFSKKYVRHKSDGSVEK